MIYKCKDCQKPLTEYEDGLGCFLCGRMGLSQSVTTPRRITMAELRQQTSVPSHGIARKEILAGNSYAKDQPEFPLKEDAGYDEAIKDVERVYNIDVPF